jgi:hypothetical protein
VHRSALDSRPCAPAPLLRCTHCRVTAAAAAHRRVVQPREGKVDTSVAPGAMFAHVVSLSDARCFRELALAGTGLIFRA